MFRNEMSRKLSLYFAAALLIFSIIIGSIFIVLFRNYTVSIHKNELENRANRIAGTLSDFMDRSNRSGYGAYMRFINDIAGADIWIVDEQHNLLTIGRGHGTYNYADLPQNAEQIINKVFTDQTVFSEDFSGLLSELTLTVGIPIKGNSGNIRGVVLLHSPVHGINEAVNQGMMILFTSIGLALTASFMLSIWLSKHFTDPITAKEAANALQIDKIRREFVANVSHELRTPVTVIRGSLEALCEKVVVDPVKIEHYHNQMLAESKFLDRLVVDLLDLSRLQNMDFVIEKNEILLCDVIYDAIRSAEQLARDKGVQIKFIKDNNEYRFFGDYGRLRQMLLIVLDNAVKFSPDKSIVEVVFKKKQLYVRDNGPGIVSEHLPYIFDRFYKSRTEINKTGTGLGLAIAKQIADRHCIKLVAESVDGQGATFTFTF